GEGGDDARRGDRLPGEEVDARTDGIVSEVDEVARIGAGLRADHDVDLPVAVHIDTSHRRRGLVIPERLVEDAREPVAVRIAYIPEDQELAGPVPGLGRYDEVPAAVVVHVRELHCGNLPQGVQGDRPGRGIDFLAGERGGRGLAVLPDLDRAAARDRGPGAD